MKQLATLTVIGRDRTGVVARITGFLFKQRANIEALEEQVTRGQFSMTVQASWDPTGLERESVRSGLQRLAELLNMEIRVRFTEPRRRQRMALLVTREPHCLVGLLDAARGGGLVVDPVVVIGNRPDLEPVVRAYRVPFVRIPWQDRPQAEARALALLEERDVDFVVLARFMKILSPNFVWRYRHKILNIHPSLLPSFPGPQAYRQAYEQGVKIVGVTAHFVTMRLDEGPIISQGCFHVRPDMTLKDIVAAGQKLETRVLLKAVKLFLARRLDVYWGVVKQV
jgi:formyltetrahydrofolate deformylase